MKTIALAVIALVSIADATSLNREFSGRTAASQTDSAMYTYSEIDSFQREVEAAKK